MSVQRTALMLVDIQTWLQQPFTLAEALPIAVMGVLLIGAIALSLRTERRVRKSVAENPNGEDTFFARLGLGALPRPAAILAFAFWIGLGAVLASSIVMTILSLPDAFEVSAADPDSNAARFALLTLTALTGALGAVIALPFTIIRTRQNERNTQATEQGLVTDRINAAVASLGVERRVSRIGRPVQVFTGDSKLVEFSENDIAAFVPPKNSIERSRTRDPHMFPPGSLDTYQWRIQVEQWPESRTIIEWSREEIRLAEGEELGEVGEWQAFDESLPNMEVRVGAILALGRIARENLSFHVQIMEILCAYVRENARADDAVPFEPPEFPLGEEATEEAIDACKKHLRDRLSAFRKALPKPRTDIQTALEVLGRRTEAQKRREGAWPDPDGDAPCLFDTLFPTAPAYLNPYTAEAHATWEKEMAEFKARADSLKSRFLKARTYRHDLRQTNLQGYDLADLDLRGTRFNGAQMQGAYLFEAQMQGADLRGAQMQGADLTMAQMQGAYLFEAQMQGVNLFEAQMQGAELTRAQMQGADLTRAQMQGAYLFEAQMQGAELFEAQMQGADLTRAQMQGAELTRAQMSELTDLTATTVRGAAVRSVDATTIAQLRPHWDVIFADGTLNDHVPDEDWPYQWPRVELDYPYWDPETSPFHIAWRAWQATLPPEDSE